MVLYIKRDLFINLEKIIKIFLIVNSLITSVIIKHYQKIKYIVFTFHLIP